MSKLTIGLLAGAALASAAVLAPMAGSAAGTHDFALNAAATVPAAAAASTTAKTTPTPTPSPLKSLARTTPILSVPAPAKNAPNPDPKSAACLKAPMTPYCSGNSERYLVKGTTITAHNLWLPVLKKWGLTSVDDGCTDPANQSADSFCVVRADHGQYGVTVLFKQFFDGQYSPQNVTVQSNAIHLKAMADASKATSVSAKATIIQNANTRIDQLQAKADAWNKAHPQTSIVVALAP